MRPHLQVLDAPLIRSIVDEAKRLLDEVGMEIRGPKLRERLLAEGLPTTADGRVRFPPDVVDRAIDSAPSSFLLYDRDGIERADLGGDRVHYVPGSSGLRVLDHRTGEARLANTTDFVEYIRLGDGLEHLGYLATAFSTNDDIEPQVSDAWRLYLVLTNTKRPVVSGAFTEHGTERMIEMMALFRRDRADLVAHPMSIFTITATGNFRYSEDSCQNLMDCVEAGIPVEIVPVTLMGLIAPVTVVGATVFHTTDVLAGITMAQILRPGAPVLFGGAPATFHMKVASSPMAAIEAQLLDVAYVEVAKSLGLPTQSYMALSEAKEVASSPMAAIEAQLLDVAYVEVAKSLGLPTQSYMALSEAKEVDAQAGAETFGSALLAALAGVNSVSGPGMLDFLLVFSLPKLVLDDELCGQALHFVRDVRNLDDIPARGLVNELLATQHLITSEHTSRHWPEELYLPGRVIDRDNRENWAKAGAPDTNRRAIAEVERRLAAYEQVETDPQAVAELQRIIKAGLTSQTELPLVPPAAPAGGEATLGAVPGEAPRGRRPNPRRGR